METLLAVESSADLSATAGLIGALIGALATIFAYAAHTHAQNINSVEATIKTSTLPLYGIGVPSEDWKLPIDPSLPPNSSHIRYVVALVNAQNLRFFGFFAWLFRLKMFGKNEDYMWLFFQQRATRTAWRHARRCFRLKFRRPIDKHLRTQYPQDPPFDILPGDTLG